MQYFIYALSIFFIIVSIAPVFASKIDFIEPIMVEIPASEFLMGSDMSPSEQPVRKVKVKSFKLAKYNVTVKEFLLFVVATDYKQSDACFIRDGENSFDINAPWSELNTQEKEFLPINCVSWNDVQAYIAWLNLQTGNQYRLPSEAEWEYAAGADKSNESNSGQLCQFENIYDRTGWLNVGRDSQWLDQPIKCEDGDDWSSVVGNFKPNSFGLYDMLGNTSEWVADCFHANYQDAPDTSEAWLDKKCDLHFSRGGSWASNAEKLRTGYRPPIEVVKNSLATNFYDRGFRLAMDAHLGSAKLNVRQKQFVKDLSLAQKAANKQKAIATKKQKDRLKLYSRWKRAPTIVPPMVTIPAGEFLMGSNLSRNEKPIHKVNIKSFRMSKYEVTIKQFKQFAKATGFIANENCWKYVTEGGGKFKVGFDFLPGDWLTPEYARSDFHPVICVSWDDANDYLTWLSQQTGKKYRLPTEAEWEYAARAGSETLYHFGNDDSLLCQYANIFDKSGVQAFHRDYQYKIQNTFCDDGSEYTSVVGMYKPNAFGLFDMIGNVSEWVQDCDHKNYKDAPVDGSAWISKECYMRIRKGSSYGPGTSRLSMRGHGGQGNRSSLGEGFRIVEDISEKDLHTQDETVVSQFELELAEKQK